LIDSNININAQSYTWVLPYGLLDTNPFHTSNQHKVTKHSQNTKTNRTKLFRSAYEQIHRLNVRVNASNALNLTSNDDVVCPAIDENVVELDTESVSEDDPSVALWVSAFRSATSRNLHGAAAHALEQLHKLDLNRNKNKNRTLDDENTMIDVNVNEAAMDSEDSEQLLVLDERFEVTNESNKGEFRSNSMEDSAGNEGFMRKMRNKRKKKRKVKDGLSKWGVEYSEIHQELQNAMECKSWRNGLRVLSILEQNAAHVRRSTYAIAAKGLQSAKRTHELAEMLSVMWRRRNENRKNVAPDEKMCASAANAASEMRQLALVKRILGEMESNGVSASAISYSVMLKAYGRAGNASGIQKTLDRMQAKSVKPDVIVFNTAIDALIRCNDFVCAREILSGMYSEWGFKPNERSYNTILKGLAEMALLDEAFALRDEMETVGLAPNSVTRNTLITACINAGSWTSAQKLVSEIGQVETDDDIVAYNTVIFGLARLGRELEAFEVLRELQASGGKASTVTYTSMLTGALADGAWPRAWFLFRGMRRFGVEPTVSTYRAMIRGLCSSQQSAQLNAAHTVFDEMRRRFPDEIDVRSYNTLISGYVEMENMQAVEYLVKQMMIKHQLAPDVVTYTALLTGYGRARNLISTRRVFREMRASKVAVDRYALNAFIAAAVRCSDLDLAVRMYNEMKTAGGSLAPDMYTYAALICGLLHGGRPEEAWMLYESMKQSSIVMSTRLIIDVARISLNRDVPRSKVLTADQIHIVLRDMERSGAPRRTVERWRREWRTIFQTPQQRTSYSPVNRKSAAQRIFEQHGWNPFDSGFRAL